MNILQVLPSNNAIVQAPEAANDNSGLRRSGRVRTEIVMSDYEAGPDPTEGTQACILRDESATKTSKAFSNTKLSIEVSTCLTVTACHRLPLEGVNECR